MAANTKISWATHTMNFWLGCDKIGPACDGCYAEKWARRAGMPDLWSGRRQRTKTWGDPPRWNRIALRDGTRPSVFSNSLADFFDNHDDVTIMRADAWRVIRDNQALDWYLVTKRIPNVEKMLPPDWSRERYGHVVIIITVVTQAEVDRDVPRLIALKQKYHWLRIGLSIEPMLGPIDLTKFLFVGAEGGVEYSYTPRNYLDWVIVGGESGGQARPMHPNWVRDLRGQCNRAGVPFHFKQWGEWGPDQAELNPRHRSTWVAMDGRGTTDNIEAALRGETGTTWMLQVRYGVDKTGRTLDGHVHDDGPRQPVVA
jgi:protein gp37